MSKLLWLYSAPLLDELFYFIIPLECYHPLFKSSDPCIHILKQHLLSTYSWGYSGVYVDCQQPFPFLLCWENPNFVHASVASMAREDRLLPSPCPRVSCLSGICLSCFHLAVTDSVLAHTLLLAVICKDQRNPECPHIMELTCLDCLCLGFLWKIQSAY